MIKFIRYIGIAGFIICLIIMYTTNIGINGLRMYDADFSLLDMRFHYAADDVSEVFEKLGEDGIAAYREFWILDFIFIACFLIVMLAAMDKPAISGKGKKLLIILAVARAVFDIIENSILLYLSSTYPTYNDLLASICSWITTFKFVFLIVWVLGFAALALYPVINRKL